MSVYRDDAIKRWDNDPEKRPGVRSKWRRALCKLGIHQWPAWDRCPATQNWFAVNDYREPNKRCVRTEPICVKTCIDQGTHFHGHHCHEFEGPLQAPPCPCGARRDVVSKLYVAWCYATTMIMPVACALWLYTQESVFFFAEVIASVYVFALTRANVRRFRYQPAPARLPGSAPAPTRSLPAPPTDSTLR